MDILSILQTALDEFNRHHGEQLYYIEDGDLIYNGNEPQTVCSVEWIDRIVVFGVKSEIEVDNYAEFTPIALRAKGPDMTMVAKPVNTNGIKH